MVDQHTITIGVGAVIFRGDSVLLVKRGKPPFLGQWSIPGGRLEFGERVEAAVHREVREETSVRVELMGLIGVYEALPDAADGGHVVMIDYAGMWRAGEPVAGDDAAEARFVPMDEAFARLSWETTRKALRDALALRERMVLPDG